MHKHKFLVSTCVPLNYTQHCYENAFTLKAGQTLNESLFEDHNITADFIQKTHIRPACAQIYISIPTPFIYLFIMVHILLTT